MAVEHPTDQQTLYQGLACVTSGATSVRKCGYLPCFMEEETQALRSKNHSPTVTQGPGAST